MNASIIALPILVPIIAAAICIFARNYHLFQRVVGLVATMVMIYVSFRLALHIIPTVGITVYLGGWAPPFGINLVADHTSILLVSVAAVVGFAAMVYSLSDMQAIHINRGFYPISLLMLAGVNGAFLTGDIFNLYVWFEIILITSFGLLMIDRNKKTLEGAIKYVSLNLVKTILFLTSVGMLYGITGTLNFADLHFVVQDIFAYGDSGALHVVAIMLLLAFGIKAGIFPLYFWLPASYHLPPSTVGALFAALLTKVGVYAILRVFTIVLPMDQLGYIPIITVVAIATMLVAILGAAADNHIRRILAFCLLSHIGSMLIGLSVYSVEAFEGMIFYMIHHILTMACLFMVAGIIIRISGTVYIHEMHGLSRRAPFVVWLFFLPALALAGIPPLSGFWGKFMLTQATLESQQYLLTASLLITGFLTLYAMLRIWHAAVWRPHPQGDEAIAKPLPKAEWPQIAAVCMLLAIIIYLGLMPEWLISAARIAAYNTMDPTAYVGLVLGGAK